MAMNGENNVEDAEMSECDGEKVVTMMDVLQEQQEFEEDANAVLGASDDMNCTYPKGYIKRQAIYACLTCCIDARHDDTKRAGVCLACSLNCHENHDLIELYTKRNFRCDCGNPKFNSHPCQFTPNKTELNVDNNYNQNFSGVYCVCRRPYPDPEAKEEEEMIQCIICEDWLHTTHLEAAVPSNDQYAEMVCKACMEKNEFLHDYSHLAVNIEMGDIDIVNVNGNDSLCNGNKENSITNGDDETISKDGDMNTETNTATNNTKLDNKEESTKETCPETEKGNDNSEKMDMDVLDTSENVNQQETESNNEPVVENKEQTDPEPTESTATEKEPDLDNVTETNEKDSAVSESKIDSAFDSSIVENTSEINKEENGELDPNPQENKTETTDDERINPDTNEAGNNIDTTEVKDKVNSNDNCSKENEPDSTETSEDKATDIPAESQDKTSEVTSETTMDTTDNDVNKASTNEGDIAPDTVDDGNEKPDNTESEESKESTNITVDTETKPKSDEITDDKTTSTDEQNSTNNGNTDSLNVSNTVHEVKDTSTEVPNPPEKRKLYDEIDESDSKKPKLSTCIRPRNVKRIYKGATFWPALFRQKLCTCNECITMYKDLSVLFLTDPEDTVSAYEMLGKEKNDGEPSTQYEKGLKALSSLNRVQQINALTEYNKMRDKLLEFLKSFKDKKEVVKEEDIKAFFAGMKPKREPDGVYFCR